MIPFHPSVARALLTDAKDAKSKARDEALFLQQLSYWLERSTKQHDGRDWVYNTLDEWADQLVMGVAELRGVIDRLVRRDIVMRIKNPKNAWDRTMWYTIDFDVLDALVEASCGDGQIDLRTSTDRFADVRRSSCGAPQSNTREHDRDYRQNDDSLRSSSAASKVPEIPRVPEGEAKRGDRRSLEMYVDALGDLGILKPEFRASDLGKPEWQEVFAGLEKQLGIHEVQRLVGRLVEILETPDAWTMPASVSVKQWPARLSQKGSAQAFKGVVRHLQAATRKADDWDGSYLEAKRAAARTGS